MEQNPPVLNISYCVGVQQIELSGFIKLNPERLQFKFWLYLSTFLALTSDNNSQSDRLARLTQLNILSLSLFGLGVSMRPTLGPKINHDKAFHC